MELILGILPLEDLEALKEVETVKILKGMAEEVFQEMEVAFQEMEAALKGMEEVFQEMEVAFQEMEAALKGMEEVFREMEIHLNFLKMMEILVLLEQKENQYKTV